MLIFYSPFSQTIFANNFTSVYAWIWNFQMKNVDGIDRFAPETFGDSTVLLNYSLYFDFVLKLLNEGFLSIFHVTGKHFKILYAA